MDSFRVIEAAEFQESGHRKQSTVCNDWLKLIYPGYSSDVQIPDSNMITDSLGSGRVLFQSDVERTTGLWARTLESKTKNTFFVHKSVVPVDSGSAGVLAAQL